VKRFVRSEIGAAVLWVIGSFVLGAVIAPWLYQAGKSFGDFTATGDFSRLIESVGGSCRRAGFGRYFNRGLMLSALVLLPFLLRRLRFLRAENTGGGHRLWEKLPWQKALIHILLGGLIAISVAWTSASLLEWMGYFAPNGKSPTFGRIFSKVLVPAVAVSLVEEWLFRGLLLGLWLRYARPFSACIGASLLFAILHFVEPPQEWKIIDPTHWLAGFSLLGGILVHFSCGVFIVSEFIPMLAVGLALAWARLRSGALWLPIALHAGWIIALKGFFMTHNLVKAMKPDPLLLGIGDMRTGLWLLIPLGLTVALCHVVIKAADGRDGNSMR
jgi:membrane protease YdiL (CAAX protease family)